MADAAKTQSTTQEQKDYIDQAKGASLSQLTSKITYAKRKIILLQMELADLKSSETGINQQIYPQKTLDFIKINLPSDRFQNKDPIPGMAPANGGVVDPPAQIGQTSNKLKKTVEDPIKEKNRAGRDALTISREIQIQILTLDEYQKRLQELGSDVQIYMDKDAISRRSYAEIYMLYEIHQKYARLTTGELGTRKYTNEAQIISQLQLLTQKFSAFGARNSYVINGVIKLDFSDPGSNMNKVALEQLLEQIRKVRNINLDAGLDSTLKKYSDQMTSNINDPWLSKQLLRQINTGREPIPEDQMRSKTTTPDKIVSYVNATVNWADKALDKIKLNYDFTSKSDGIKSWFRSWTSGIYNGIPHCEPVAPSPTDVSKAAADVKSSANEKKAGDLYAKQLESTKIKESETVITIPNFGYNLSAAINNYSNQNKIHYYVLTIRPVLSTQSFEKATEYGPSRTLYEFNIISEAQKLYDSLFPYIQNGNTKTYDFYVTELIRLLNSVNPPLLKTGS